MVQDAPVMRMRSLAVVVVLSLAVAPAACARPDRDHEEEPGAPTTETPTSASSPSQTATTTDGVDPTPATDDMTSGAMIDAVTETRTIVHDGVERTYRIHVPTGLSADERWPLVLGLHGGLGSGEGFATRNHLDEEADRAVADGSGFIAVSPDGTTDASGRFRTWNGGYCCGPAQRMAVDDVGFMRALVAEVSAELPVDQDRVFAMGHSNGGIMAYRLACEASDTFAAVGVVAGSMGGVDCEPDRSVSIIHIHGDADRNHPIDGGVGTAGISGVSFNSARSSIDALARLNGCDSSPDVTQDDSGITSRWTGCEEDVGVEFQQIRGGSHAWPGGEPSPLSGVTGEPGNALDATAVIWSFFEAHGR